MAKEKEGKTKSVYKATRSVIIMSINTQPSVKRNKLDEDVYNKVY